MADRSDLTDEVEIWQYDKAKYMLDYIAAFGGPVQTPVLGVDLTKAQITLKTYIAERETIIADLLAPFDVEQAVVDHLTAVEDAWVTANPEPEPE